MENSASLVPIFFIGLLVGGLSCMAVQGGLLAATISQRTEERLKNNLKKQGHAFPILIFLLAKLIAYTVLGFFLGWFGSLFQLSLQAQIVLQLFVALFMIGTAFNLLNVHPIFRYFIIQPPKVLTRFVRKESKSKDLFAPALLGALTVFIPCGTTQGVMALSIASANPISGAFILFAFTLGTSPVFFVLGYFATKLGDILNKRFAKVAATAILLIAVFNINNAIALTGSSFTLENLGKNIQCAISFCERQVQGAVADGKVEITIGEGGYTPSEISVRAGSLVSLKLVNNGGGGCAAAFTIPTLNIQKVVTPGNEAEIEFQAPEEIGEIPFMCSMGMYRGRIRVI